MQSTWPSYLDSMSKSQVNVKGFTLEFPVRSVSPEPFDQFSWYFTHMFLFERWRADHITQPPRLKTVVTGRGQRIYPWILCPLHISWALEAVFIKLLPNISLSEIMCRAYDATTQTQGRGHNSRSCDLPFKCVRFISAKPFELVVLYFIQMFLLVRQCAERMT